VKITLVAAVARRQILSRANSGFVRTISVLSVIGIAIGVAALVILNSFMDGFSDTIMRNLASMNPPVEVRIPGGGLFGDREFRQAVEILSRFPSVDGVSPVLEKTVVLAGKNGEVAGAKFRGVDWNVEPRLAGGDGPDLSGAGEGEIVLGTVLAGRLGVSAGDTVRLAYTDSVRFSSMGTLLLDTIMAIRVADVTDFGIEEYNSSMVLGDLSTASLMFGDGVRATTLSVGLAEDADPVSTAASINSAMREAFVSGGMEYMVCNAFVTYHRNLFAALGLEKMGMTIVLALIGVVALLNLLSTLTMIAMEHRRDCGVLRSMGASPGMVLSIAVFQGGMIGSCGALAGVLFALAAIFTINGYFPIRLESSVYWIDTLPGEVRPGFILLVFCSTLAASLLVSLFPAISAVRIPPAEAVRYE